MSRRKHKSGKGKVVKFKQKTKAPSKFQFCVECKETNEIQYDSNLQEYFCTQCGCAIEGEMINLPENVKKGISNNGNGYQGNLGYHGSTTYVQCDHTGDKVIFEKGGKKLYAANNKGLNEFSGNWELIIDLAGIVPTPSAGFVKTSNPKKYDVLRQYTGKYTQPKSEILRLDWPDFSPPAAMLDFWLELWKILPDKSVICCQGGHGRTGTCLASFMISQGLDYYTAFTTVRAEHCEKAIESVSQARYLHGLYGEMLKRQLTAATAKGDTVIAAVLAESLDYASKHLPTSDDLLGGDILNSTVTTTAKGYNNTTSNFSQTAGTKNPEIQCPGCAAWLKFSAQFNDYWCSECKRVIRPAEAKSLGPAANPLNDPSMIDDGSDFEQPRIKRVLGTIYIKECVDPACGWSEQEDCQDPDHLAWVKWDDYHFKEATVY